MGPNSFTANWDAAPGATGYRLDVSKHNDFSTFVTGYDGSYISGGGTTSATVTGLLWGNTYYYRVRSSADYVLGEFESGHSNVTDVVTGILPVVFTGIAARKVNGKTEVTFSIASESNVRHYELQKSMNGSTFLSTGIITHAMGNSAKYSLVDPVPSGSLTFYRISALSENGSIEFSNIVAVRSPALVCRLRIISNPVNNGALSFTTETLPDGKYTVTILGTSGELLLRKELIFRQGVMTTIPLHRFQAGSYILFVKGVVQFSELFVLGR